MSIDSYGVWVAKPVRVSAERAEQDDRSPHIHLFYDDGTGGSFDNARRASINVKSLSELSELVFWHELNFRHSIVDRLPEFNMGFHTLESAPGGIALDYIRGNLIDFEEGRVLPHDLPGERDDIIDFVMPELQAAINREATVYLFGEPFSDNQGIHNIHMNQGSQGRFERFNGVWQDGGIIIHFPDEDRFAAIFLAFASQAIHTDDESGNGIAGSQNFAQLLGRIPGNGGITIPDDLRVAIVAALVNPVGSENQPGSASQESVYLINRSTQEEISIGGWSILNRNDQAQRIPDGVTLAAGEVKSIALDAIPLSNQGGLISLLDDNGIKVDGVSYTREQARPEGELILFR
ncbi:DUF2278 family protein [Acaryochloris sp. IP29b_bin.137]|uniref:DUF2278 family protein n=1 Tax=Acaryochloris sp. IP29b_bin.137 TaxID=2969217 RepID=UPI0026139356|nr:DUF2278 family protein [Acaryochloris sp. IP29b_bin.137]